jgi:hypothetical protein
MHLDRPGMAQDQTVAVPIENQYAFTDHDLWMPAEHTKHRQISET